MFLRTSERLETGTPVNLRFVLQQGQAPIQAKAAVAWCRVRDVGPDQPRGIGVIFLEIDLQAKYEISRLVDRYLQLGTTPILRDSGEFPIVIRRQAGNSAARLALTFLAGLVVGWAGSVWFPRAGTDDLRDLRGLTGGPATLASGSPPPSAVAQPTEPASPAAVEATITAWAHAWSEKNVEDYLGWYADEFRPSSGLPLERWKSQRRERLSRKGAIQVEVSSLEIEAVDPDRTIARFDQAFTSPGYRDRVRKALELVRREQHWKIVREEVLTP